MASATQLFMQHFTGKPGVHDLYSEKGFPVSARSVDSSGATREYKFADGTRYMEPTEPSTAQYADGASLAFAPLRVAKQGGSALRVAGSAAGNVVDYAASNYASRRASEATGGYLGMVPMPLTAMILGGRGRVTSGVVGALDDGLAAGKTAAAAESRLTTSVGDIRASGVKDAHHVVQDAAVKSLPGYSTHKAPGIPLPGPSTAIGTPHYIATQIQRQSGGGTLAAELRIAYKAIRRAGHTESDARTIIRETMDYFESIGASPSSATRIPGNR